MPNFEYAVIEVKVFGGFEIEFPDRQEKVKGELVGLLNGMGSEGWELVNVTDDQAGGARRLFLKRSRNG